MKNVTHLNNNSLTLSELANRLETIFKMIARFKC